MRLMRQQELCEQKGLDCAWLKKAQLLALLKQADSDAAGLASADADEIASVPESDTESELNVRNDDSVGDNVDATALKRVKCW